MRTQKVICEWYQDNGFPHAESAGAGRPGRDILGIIGIAAEVKARTGLDLPAWMRQAKKEAEATGDIPVLHIRLNGQGEETVADWPTVIPTWVYFKLLKEAGYGDQDDR